MRRILLLSIVLTAAMNAAAGTGRVVIVNGNLPGVGFNDPTPALPVGGNSGTTIGQQRLNVFAAAAAKWTTILDTDVDILVDASFVPIECSATDAVLGQARPIAWLHDFADAPRAGVWYPIALANKFAGSDLDPGAPDIFIQFNSSVDNSTCLGESNWYYGLDGNEGPHSDLFVVVLHEMAHGLGLSGKATAPNFSEGRPAAFDVHTLDLTAGLRWDQMSDAQRRVSLTNTGKVVWDGENVRAMTSRYLQPTTSLAISEPATLARNYEIGTASFGPRVNSTSLSAPIVQALDSPADSGASTTDGCSALSNALAVADRIAMVDRRGCTFLQKARMAQAAGARGLIVVDKPDPANPTAQTCIPPGMGVADDDPSDIFIPLLSITQHDGNEIKAQLTASVPVSGSLHNDPTQLAGTSAEGFLRLYAPCTNDPGSSIHHWDVVASPNLLMEPSVNVDLLHGFDLTMYQLLDIGWTLRPRSGRPPGSR